MTRNHRTLRRARPVPIVCLSWVLLMVGCAAPLTPDDLLRADLDPQRRVRELRRMGPIAQHQTPPHYARVLYTLIESDSQPDALRNLAIDRLLVHDEPELRRWAIEHVTAVDRWPVLEHLFDVAIQNQWADFLPAAVASYARPSREFADADRPERRVIQALRPAVDVQQAVFDVFDAPPQAVAEDQRIAAWVLLNRLGDARRSLNQASSDALLVQSLKQASRALERLPATPQSVAMLTFAQLSPDWPRRINRSRPVARLRHLMLPLHQRPVAAADIAIRLTAARHVTRSERADRDPRWSEDFDHWRDQLSPDDLRVIAFVLDAMKKDHIIDMWFAEADADRIDQTTEYGGVLGKRADGRFEAIPYQPDLRAHDRQFVASTRMLMRIAAGGIHYHFHAQSLNNAEYAAPGPGDLEFANRYEIAALILTFVDPDTLNVDYYQPLNDPPPEKSPAPDTPQPNTSGGGGIVIDLGCVTRRYTADTIQP